MADLIPPHLIPKIQSFFALLREKILESLNKLHLHDNDEHTILYASGLPRTHPVLIGRVVGEKGFVNFKIKYIKTGEIDIKDLLYAARRELYMKAVELGGNALTDESWTCQVKDRNGVSKIKIRYRGKSVVSGQIDPQAPINISDQLDEMAGDWEGRAGWRRLTIFRPDSKWYALRRTTMLDAT